MQSQTLGQQYIYIYMCVCVYVCVCVILIIKLALFINKVCSISMIGKTTLCFIRDQISIRSITSQLRSTPSL